MQLLDALKQMSQTAALETQVLGMHKILPSFLNVGFAQQRNQSIFWEHRTNFYVRLNEMVCGSWVGRGTAFLLESSMLPLPSSIRKLGYAHRLYYK